MPNIKIPSGVRHGVEVDVHTPPMPPIALPSAHHVSICAGMTYHYVSMRRTLEHSQASPRDAGACRAEWSAYTRPRLMSAWTIKYFFGKSNIATATPSRSLERRSQTPKPPTPRAAKVGRSPPASQTLIPCRISSASMTACNRVGILSINLSKISSVILSHQIFSIIVFNASISSAHPQISPNSVFISLHTDSIGFKSDGCAGHSSVSIPFNAL